MILFVPSVFVFLLSLTAFLAARGPHGMLLGRPLGQPRGQVLRRPFSGIRFVVGVGRVLRGQFLFCLRLPSALPLGGATFQSFGTSASKIYVEHHPKLWTKALGAPRTTQGC